jgi:hypothetical protein
MVFGFTYHSLVRNNLPVHGLEERFSLRCRSRCQGDEVVVVDVHSLRRPVAVLEEGMLRLSPVLAHGARRGPDVSGSGVVLVARAAHLTLGRRVGHVTEDAAVKTLGLGRRLKEGNSNERVNS